MRTIQLDLVETLLLALVGFFVGRALIARLYLAGGSAAGVKVSKQTATLGVTIPLHPEADRYFALGQARAASAPQAPGTSGAKPRTWRRRSGPSAGPTR